MDKLRAMQTFVRIVDKGSLTAAATSLGTSLPAVVRTLAALEAHLQVRLLNRTTRRLALTEDGRSYLDSCRRILATIDEVEAGLTTRQVELAGHLTVTAPMLFGQMYVAPAVTRFVQRYPAVHCSLNFADRVVDLLEEGVDVGVRIGPLRDSTLIAQPVGRIRRVVVATPAFLRKHGVPRHPEDLAREPCLRFSNGNPHWWTFQDDGRVFQVQVTGNLEFNQNRAGGRGLRRRCGLRPLPVLSGRAAGRRKKAAHRAGGLRAGAMAAVGALSACTDAAGAHPGADRLAQGRSGAALSVGAAPGRSDWDGSVIPAPGRSCGSARPTCAPRRR